MTKLGQDGQLRFEVGKVAESTGGKLDWLKAIGACQEAIEWVGDRPIQEAWDACGRGDWMLWLIRRMADKPGWPSLQAVVGLCCDCADLGGEYWIGDAPRLAIEASRAWCRGEASIEDVTAAAWDAGDAAGDVAIKSAAWAAAMAASTAAHVANVTWAAGSAANAAATANALAAATSFDRDDVLRRIADIVRAAVPRLPKIGDGGEVQ